jgi:8-oxo-dGTP pyrophosphatase MutT (NUDIX family)
MALLTPWRKKAEIVKPDDVAFRTAVGAIAKSIHEDEQLAKGFLDGNAAKMPGTSWSNQGTVNNSLIARVTQNLASQFDRTAEEVETALAENGLSWGPPFPPGRPLDPFWGYRRPPRTWNYSVGENVQLTPRWNRISFPTLKSIIDSYYAAQICVRHLINDVRSLDYQFIPPMNVTEDATDDLRKAEEFFTSPDKRQPFRAWLAEYLQDVLRYDAGALYIRRNNADEPIALEVVSGSTIIPLIDFFGRPPVDEEDGTAFPDGTWEGDTVPAFTQIVEGLPWVWLAKDDLIYQPLNPLPESQYGLAPMEAVLLQANTDIRFQWHFLQYFTEGSIPAGFMEAPPDLSDPIQVQEWQETWDAVMLGDQAKLRQVRWVPAGASFTAVKNNDFNSDFPLYLMRCTAAAFGVTPNDLGFTEDVNRSTGETQVNIQFRVGTLPIVRHVEDVINLFISEHLGLQARIAFDTGQGTSHRLEIAQTNDIYIKNGTLSNDEVRMSLGKRISRDRPMTRYIDNTRQGPIPILAMESLAGKIDPTTYGPDKEQDFIEHPFAVAPGAVPIQGTKEYTESREATARMQRNMQIQDASPDADENLTQEEINQATRPSELLNATKAAYDVIDLLLDRLAEKNALGGAPSNTGGPGITVSTGAQGVDLIKPKKKKKAKKSQDSFSPPEGVRAAARRAVQWIEEGHAGSGFTSTGSGRAHDLASGKSVSPEIAKRMKAFFDRHQVDKKGKGFHQGEEGYPSPGRVAWDAWGGDAGYSWVKRIVKDDPAEKAMDSLRQWRENSLNRVRKGLPPRRFDDLPSLITNSVWPNLVNATTREQVIAAFSGDVLGKSKDDKQLNRRAAGIAVQAKDTGRVVLVQRVPNKHDDDDVNARWEWPGGKLDGGGDGNNDESVWAGALREWHEETGAVMPHEYELVGGWVSDDDEYEGFVVRVPRETDIEFDPQPEEASACGWWHPDDLEDDDVRQKIHDQLGDIQPLLEEE